MRVRLMLDGDGTGDERRLNTLVKMIAKMTQGEKMEGGDPQMFPFHSSSFFCSLL